MGDLLPLLAVLAGVVAHYKPLVSTRPTVPSEKTIPVIAAQDVDARLWQDPFSVAQKQKSLLDAQIEAGAAKKGSTESHDIRRAGRAPSQTRDAEDENPERVLLLAVMIEAGTVQRTRRVPIARAASSARSLERERIRSSGRGAHRFRYC